MSDLINEAKQALQGEERTFDALFDLGKALKKKQKFNLARRVFGKAHALTSPDHPRSREVVQQHASCTEKDPDLPIDRRFDEANDIIRPVLAEAEAFAKRPLEERAATDAATIRAQQETYGIAGAIQKRWWEADPRPAHLSRALELYQSGYRLGTEPDRPTLPDQGYTGINVAFVLELIAQQEEKSGSSHASGVAARREQARTIRTKIVAKLETLPEQDWWTLATLAEATLGLGDYDAATRWLEQAATFKAQRDPWEYETMVKQLGRLAMLQAPPNQPAESFVDSAAWRALKSFVGEDEAGLLTAFSGRVGLALSGGGFRASLFHIGVLARLAELDMLRHVEVLSCVSGGSIVGALYYLKLRALLQSKSDDDITREDYVNLLHELERQFMDAIEVNPRMRVFSAVTSLPHRTERMGELLDETLYAPAAGVAKGERPLLRDLTVKFPDNPGFNPKHENWRRKHKVPMLILNATALNTGHNWQFTASFMGESPNTIDPEVDGNERLRRMYYHEAPPPHHIMPLGRAVAASAAVPGLFSPVKLRGLYPDRDVELVDGGVHDNQGVGGLREQDCAVLLISDASGQLVTERAPGRFELSVLRRSNDTLMARVRELEHKELCARKRAGLLREFMFVHLKKDLLVEPVNWKECDLNKESRQHSGGARPDSDDLTRYGVRGNVQNLLSGIRTDLDAFGECEAFALMASGYKMTTWEFPRSITSFPSRGGADSRWRFLQVDRLLNQPAGSEDFMTSLKLGGVLLFKGPSLFRGAGLVKRGARLVIFAAFGMVLLGLLIGLGQLIRRVPLVGVPLALLGSCVLFLVFGGLYSATRIFDRRYLAQGSVRNLLRPLP